MRYLENPISGQITGSNTEISVLSEGINFLRPEMKFSGQVYPENTWFVFLAASQFSMGRG